MAVRRPHRPGGRGRVLRRDGGPEERTGRFLDYFFAPDVDEGWIDELIAFDTQVGVEDRALVEGVQRGVRSGVLAEGRLLSQSEQLVAHFQQLCAGALGS